MLDQPCLRVAVESNCDSCIVYVAFEGHRASEEGGRQVEETDLLDEPAGRVRRPVLVRLVLAVSRDRSL